MFGDIGIRRVVNGPDGYTPDGHCLLGPVSGAPNFHVAAGFSIFGIVFAGGIGRQAAEWIVNGEPSRNVWPFAATRFGPYARSRHYVFDRASEVYEREYAVRFPFEELSAARPVRISPLYDSLAGKGAVFGERSGWERPLYFDRLPSTDSSRLSHRRGEWERNVADECRAVRSGVAALDQTSFAKFRGVGTARPSRGRLPLYQCSSRRRPYLVDPHVHPHRRHRLRRLGQLPGARTVLRRLRRRCRDARCRLDREPPPRPRGRGAERDRESGRHHPLGAIVARGASAPCRDRRRPPQAPAVLDAFDAVARSTRPGPASVLHRRTRLRAAP